MRSSYLLASVFLLLLSIAVSDGSDRPWENRLSVELREQVDKLNQQVGRLEAERNHAEAIGIGKQLVAIYEEHLGARHFHTCWERGRLGVIETVGKLSPEEQTVYHDAQDKSERVSELSEKGDFEKARQYLQESLAASEQLFGENSMPAWSSRLQLAIHFRSRNQFRQAEEQLEKTLAIWEEVAGYSHPELAGMLEMIAHACASQQKWQEAESYLQKSIAESEKVFSPNDRRIAHRLYNLYDLQVTQRKDVQALTSVKKAAQVADVAYGDHPFTVDVYESLGDAHTQLSKFIRYSDIGSFYLDDGPLEEAEKAYRRAHDILSRMSPGSHRALAMRTFDLAENLYRQGRMKDAESYYRVSLQHRIEGYGSNHRKAGLGYHHLAHCLEKQGLIAQAYECHVKAIEIYDRVGEEAPLAIAALAANRRRWGDYISAEKYYRKALALLEKREPDSPSVAYTYDNLGQALNSQGRHDDAIECYFKALPILVNHFSEEHPYTAVCYSNLAVAFSASGRKSQAEFYARKALLIGLANLGNDSRGAIMRALNMATILDAQGKFAEAAELHRDALAISRRVYPDGGLDAVVALRAVAIDESRDGRHEHAIELQTEGHQILTKLLGPNNRNTSGAKSTLAILIERSGDYARAEKMMREILEWCVMNLAKDDLAAGP